MQRLWLHALLLLLTMVTTTVVGSRMMTNFERNLPAFILDDLLIFVDIWSEPALLWKGLPFSFTLIGILLAHELGHYFACVFHRVNASLPYFLPVPSPIGTFGAFIRIREPILSRRILFDIGVAGPLAGFAVLLPALGVGLAYSKVMHGIAKEGDLLFGAPLLVWAASQLVFPGVEQADLYLHPMARAAWVGLLATALNLLPIGQLDGGHILYSVAAARHKLLSQVFSLILAITGIAFGWAGWILWAVFFVVTGMRHPPIVDETPVGAGRLRLACLALAILVLSFTPVLVRGSEFL
ncbi:MAG: site-2 protease family protein [Acidobacteria bacterium]|nr:site-2 protease family protein [Acidobacteriota bacterium]